MDFVGLIAVLGAFAMPAYVVKVTSDNKRKRAELAAGPGNDVTAKLVDENKLLRERVENLESIVCSVDHDLNLKLARVIDEHRSLVLAPAAPGPMQLAAAEADAAPANAALDRTATLAPSSRPPPATPTELEPGQLLAQRYRIQRLIGRGGMGAVYLADDEVLKELVALKVISSAFAGDEAAMIGRFRREAAAARKVSSPAVIRIHDLGEARPGLLYLSMEYFAGRTLSEVITQRGVVPLDDARDYLRQICEGLEAAHQAGVVHRDLKPGNVLIGERGVVKIIDFGLATTTFGEGLTATGTILGTPHYMAPEQVRGKSVDARSDIYALGALAYHLVCGRPPFSGDNAIAVGFAHLTEPPLPPRQIRKDCSAAMEAAILAALAKQPADRPASAKQFAERAFAS
jgi:serine/threonine protein kinase